MRGRTRRENPIYPVSFWNVKKKGLTKICQEQIANAVEGFHSALCSSIIWKHPNIWKLIAALKKEELQQTKIIHVNRGDAPARKKIYNLINILCSNII